MKMPDPGESPILEALTNNNEYIEENEENNAQGNNYSVILFPPPEIPPSTLCRQISPLQIRHQLIPEQSYMEEFLPPLLLPPSLAYRSPSPSLPLSPISPGMNQKIMTESKQSKFDQALAESRMDSRNSSDLKDGKVLRV